MINLISNHQPGLPIEIRKCPGWHGSIPIEKIRDLLTGQPANTYTLSLDNTTLFLAYVTKVGEVKLISVKKKDEWYHKNGTYMSANSLEELIEKLMDCSKPIPLEPSFI